MDEIIKLIFKSSKTIALIGASTDSKKDSFIVMKYLQDNGFKVLPVNPFSLEEEILGEKIFNSIEDIHEDIDIVNVFRPMSESLDLARKTIAANAKTFWLQLNIKSPEAKKIIELNNINFIEDKCTKKEHERLFDSLL